jgi:hypothetical protein
LFLTDESRWIPETGEAAEEEAEERHADAQAASEELLRRGDGVAAAAALDAPAPGGLVGGWGRVRRKMRRRSEGRERQFEFFDDSISIRGGSLPDAFVSDFGPFLFRPNVERREARNTTFFYSTQALFRLEMKIF